VHAAWKMYKLSNVCTVNPFFLDKPAQHAWHMTVSTLAIQKLPNVPQELMFIIKNAKVLLYCLLKSCLVPSFLPYNKWISIGWNIEKNE